MDGDIHAEEMYMRKTQEDSRGEKKKKKILNKKQLKFAL